MGTGFGGNPIYNRASPSSHERCVNAIIREFLSKGGRVLDIGGTGSGFRSQAALPAGSTVVIANPERGVGADYRFVSDIPPSVERFDLAMLFGVMMYLERAPLVALMDDVRRRLKPRGTFLIAEPNPEGVVGAAEILAKTIYAAIKSLWDPTKFTFYTVDDTKGMLREAGFHNVAERSDLTPNRMGVFPPPQPPYYVVAARV